MPPVKCVTIGDSCAGKTCLLRTFINKSFYKAEVSTTFAEYLAEVVTLNGSVLELCLCDTSGQECFDNVRSAYYPNTEVFLVCFSVADRRALENIRQRWVPEIRRFCPAAPILLVGTKADLRDENRKQNSGAKLTTYGQGAALAEEIEAVAYMECSALTTIGVAKIFDTVASCAIHSRGVPQLYFSPK